MSAKKSRNKGRKKGGGKGGGKGGKRAAAAPAPNPNATPAADAAGDRAFTALISAQAGGPTVPLPTGNPQVPLEAPSVHFAGGGSSFPHLTRPFPGAAADTPGYHQHITDIRQQPAYTALPQMYDDHSGAGDQVPPVGAAAYVIHERIRQTVDPATDALSAVDVDRLIATPAAPAPATGAFQAVSASHIEARGSGAGALGSADSPGYIRVMTTSTAGAPLSPRSRGRV